jgi:putative tryptophan/tyrosine transport system substrate-binding protein
MKKPKMLFRKVVAVALAAQLAASCSPANDNKQSVTIFTYVTYPILDESITGIKQGLADEGFAGANLQLKEVNANGQSNLVNSYTREILATHPTILIPVSTPITQAVVSAAGANQQIVFSTVTNPNDVGMQKKPSNLTGVSDVVNYAANIDLIQELVPGGKRIAMLYNPAEANSQFAVEQLRPIITKRGLTLKLVSVSKSDEVVAATRALLGQADAIYVGSDNTVASAIDGLVATARQIKMPIIASDAGSVEKGALAAVSVDYRELGRAVGHIAGQLLKNRKSASSIPNMLFEGKSLIINLDAAASTGFKFPAGVLGRANRTVSTHKAAA